MAKRGMRSARIEHNRQQRLARHKARRKAHQGEQRSWASGGSGSPAGILLKGESKRESAGPFPKGAPELHEPAPMPTWEG